MIKKKKLFFKDTGLKKVNTYLTKKKDNEYKQIDGNIESFTFTAFHNGRIQNTLSVDNIKINNEETFQVKKV